MAGTFWYQQGPSDDELPLLSEPSAVTPIGDADREPLGIYLGNTAAEEIERLTAEDPGASVFGLLAGRPCSSGRRSFVLVTHALALGAPESEDGEPQISSEVLEPARESLAQLGDGFAVLGWFSARPRKGAEITPYERYVHRKHFPRNWQFALLIDSADRTSRLYRWESERLLPCDNFYVWNAKNEPFEALAAGHTASGRTLGEGPVESAVYETVIAWEAPVAATTEKRRRSWWVWAAACLIFIYALIPQAPGSILWLKARQLDRANDLVKLERDLAQLELEASRLAALREQPGGPQDAAQGLGASGTQSAQIDPSAQGDRSTQAVQNLQISPATQVPSAAGATLSGPTGSPASPAFSTSPAAAGFAERPADYVIQPGDTMWAISSTLLGDPWQYRVLAQENQIPDPDLIFPGQRLRLPGEAAP